MPHRGRVTQHTIQPHIASKPANIPPRHGVKEQPEISPHPPKISHGLLRPYPTSLSTQNTRHTLLRPYPTTAKTPPRTGVRCDPTPMVFYCACHTVVLPYMLEGQLRPYPPHRGRVTTDSKEVGSQPTPLPFALQHRISSSTLIGSSPWMLRP